MSSAITHFAESFVWENRHAILSFTLIGCFVIEGLYFLWQAVVHRKEIAQGFKSLLRRVSSNPLEGESLSEAKRRQIIQIAKVATAILLGGALVAVCYQTLPVFLATAIAINGLLIIFRTTKDPMWVFKELKKCKEKLISAFTKEAEETKVHFGFRITKNILLGATMLTVFVFSCIALNYFLAGTLYSGTSWITFNPEFLRLISSPFLIFGAHILMGLYAGYKAVDSLKEKKYLEAIYFLMLIGSRKLGYQLFTFDYSNILVRNFKKFATVLLGCCTFQALSSGLFSKKAKASALSPCRDEKEEPPVLSC